MTVRSVVKGGVVCCLLLANVLASAQEWSASAYGTLGYAVSDRSYRYLRFIDDQGTVRKDSVLGGQVDVRFNPQWAATVQVKIAPSMANEAKWGVNAPWAFVSWRPGNDWLLRAGRQRLPLYLNSESVDVGQTYDFARLPQHFYGLMPSNEFTGLYASRTWTQGNDEFSVDAYGGESSLPLRAYTRDGGVDHFSDDGRYIGMALTLRQPTATWRFGAHRFLILKKDRTDMGANFPYVDTGGGTGYYKVDDRMPGPDIGRAPHKTIHVFTLGADVELAPAWRLVSEIVRSQSPGHADANWSTISGYVGLFHRMERFTPYVSISRLKSMGTMARLSEALDHVNYPAFMPSAALINQSQRVAADYVGAMDETAWAVGTSLAITSQSKLKFEWMRTEVGKRSAYVDSPGPQAVRQQHINVLTANYSFVY